MDKEITLSALPNELKEKIVKYLDVNTLLALSATNKEYYELCTMPKLWAEMGTGNMFLWGQDSTRVLARLAMPRYRHLIHVTIQVLAKTLYDGLDQASNSPDNATQADGPAPAS